MIRDEAKGQQKCLLTLNSCWYHHGRHLTFPKYCICNSHGVSQESERPRLPLWLFNTSLFCGLKLRLLAILSRRVTLPILDDQTWNISINTMHDKSGGIPRKTSWPPEDKTLSGNCGITKSIQFSHKIVVCAAIEKSQLQKNLPLL